MGRDGEKGKEEVTARADSAQPRGGSGEKERAGLMVGFRPEREELKEKRLNF